MKYTKFVKKYMPPFIALVETNSTNVGRQTFRLTVSTQRYSLSYVQREKPSNDFIREQYCEKYFIRRYFVNFMITINWMNEYFDGYTN